MATKEIFPALAVRSSGGLELWNTNGLKDPYVPFPEFVRDESKFCRAMVYSPNGRYLAWANGITVSICSCQNWKILCSLTRPKAFYLKFSPNGTYLILWELFTTNKDNPNGSPNLHIYKSDTGEEMLSIIQKRNSDWEPNWSEDESVVAFMLGGEAHFYETNGPNGFSKSEKKVGSLKNGLLSIAPGSCPPFVAFYIPGVKDSPSMCKIFKYPTVNIPQPIACKSFFQADRIELLWNKRGTGLLLLTSTDIDKTNASYYGKTALHFMSTKGDSFAVKLNKDGPVHAVSWSPKSTEFCVIYGFMPSKAAFFNLKCDSIFEIDEGPRNSIYYNSFGNMVILAGFGNLRGNVEVWDTITKKQISTLQAPDSTLVEWCPNGITFVTATTAPRLRMGNGFKVWHYSGALLHETPWPTGQELLQVSWQTYPEIAFKEPLISNVKIEGIKPNQPEASKEVYRPPNARGIKDDGSVPTIPGLYQFIAAAGTGKNAGKKYKQKENYKKNKNEKTAAGNVNNKPTGSNLVITTDKIQSGTAATTNINTVKVNAERNDVRHASKFGFKDKPNNNINSNNSSNNSNNMNRNINNNEDNNNTSEESVPLNKDDQDKKRERKKMNRILKNISKLKSKQENGENLSEIQLAKISAETELIAKVKNLSTTANSVDDHQQLK